MGVCFVMHITLRLHTSKTSGQERVFKIVGFHQTKNIVFSLDICMTMLTRARFLIQRPTTHIY
jgi:hypothetical protein